MSDQAEFNVTYDPHEMTREQLIVEVMHHREKSRKLWRKELRRRRFWGLDEQIIDWLSLRNEVATLKIPSYETFIKHFMQGREYLIGLLEDPEVFQEIFS